MARGSLRAAGGLLGCPPEDAADLATELLDAVPAELHVSPDLGPHPRKVDDLLPPAFGPPLDVGDLPFPLPPFTGATQFRAATLLLSGRVPETWDHTSTGDLYRMALTSRETGLPTDHFERWIAQTLSGPPALNSDGTPDWQADHNRYSELMNVAYSRVGDRLASKVDDPWVQHRIMCPAAPHRGWQKAPHGEAPDQSGVCDAVGHDTDDRWLGWHDRPTRATLLRGLKAARRAAEYHSGDWHGYAHHLGAVLAQAAPDLSGYLSIATDPTITSALVEVLHAAGLDAPPVGDPAAVWHAALEHTERTGTWGWDEAQDVNDLLAGLLLRSARWSEPLHLDVGHVALITDTQDFAQR